MANYGVGIDHINVEDCTARNVTVTNTPGVLTGATADMAWALLMASARRIVEVVLIPPASTYLAYQG